MAVSIPISIILIPVSIIVFIFVLILILVTSILKPRIPITVVVGQHNTETVPAQ